MSPYFCCSVLSFILKTAGMKSERRNSSAIIAFPLETILRMAWPHRLFSAKKSTMAAGGGGGGGEDERTVRLCCTYCFSIPVEYWIETILAVKTFCLPTTKYRQSFCRDIRHDMPASCFILSHNVYYYKYAVQENAHICDRKCRMWKCTFVLKVKDWKLHRYTSFLTLTPSKPKLVKTD